MTRYREACEAGASLLSEIHGSSQDGKREALLEARFLLEAVCGTKMQDLLLNPDRVLSEEEEASYRVLLEKRLRRIPVAYLLGEQEFMGLSFTVTPSVLIPRQDTELLVEEALREMTDGFRILDLCTGSGCILLSLLHYSNGSTGIGTDIDEGALEVAAGNANRLGLEDRVTFLQGDLFAPVRGREHSFDLITANPPYIRTGDLGSLQPEVRNAEPRLALDGGEDGLSFYRRIAREAPFYLDLGGMLLMEIGCDQAEEVLGILEARGYYEPEVYKDYGGNDRVVRAFKGTRTLEL